MTGAPKDIPPGAPGAASSGARVPPVLAGLPAAQGPANAPRRRTGTTRPRDDWRLILVIFAFILVYGAVGVRMGTMATEEPAEPRLARDRGEGLPVRREIVDRNGTLIAANLPAYSLYAHPNEIKDIPEVARQLSTVFTDTTPAEFEKILTRSTKFVWVRRPITPTERQQVLDLGQPGLMLGSRMMRIYPPGKVVSHIVGGVRAASEDVNYAELVGSGGVEGYFDKTLRDPSKFGEPLQLSLDLAVQNAMREVLLEGIDAYHAKGAAGVLLSVRTGEVLAMVSLPDYDPNEQPKPFKGPAGSNPRFDRTVQGRYELGSTFKVLTAAAAIENGIANADTMIETGTPISFGRFRIRDMHHMPAKLSLTDVIVRSSNVGAAHLALGVGTPRFKDYFKRMGFFDPLPLEMEEARGAPPLLPPKWTDLSSMTISFGHGLAVSPVHLAAGYATIANGGRRVMPTLIKGGRTEPGEQVLSERTSEQMMQVIRQVVVRGTGRRTNVAGYSVGGKTGTADKPNPYGGYYRDRVIASFVSVFPTNDPQYAMIISLDEPTNTDGKRPIREASMTAVPVTSKAINRIAPLLDMRPAEPQPDGDTAQTVASIATARD